MALDFFAGCLGGMAGVVVGHPFDTLKVIVQTQKNAGACNSSVSCFKNLVQKEGFRGLYKGVVTPVLGSVVINAAIFGVYGNAERELKAFDVIYPCVLAGGISGLVQTPLTTATDLIKIRYQITPLHQRQNKTIYEFVKHIYRTEGMSKGLFKGTTITAMREVPSLSIYFLTYDLLTTTSTPNIPISTLHMLMAGGIAGQASWLCTYPIDVIKSRIQSDHVGAYKGIVDCAIKSYRADGYTIFTRGLLISMARAFPTNAVCFAVVHWTFRWHDSLFGQVDDNNDHIETKIKVSSDNFRICDVNPQSNLQLPC